MDPGRGLIIAVLIIVVIGAPIWAAVQSHRNPNSRPRVGWPVFIVIAILLVTVFIATLL
jgi:type IV secretory pathway VirB2 component (pilin)